MDPNGRRIVHGDKKDFISIDFEENGFTKLSELN